MIQKIRKKLLLSADEKYREFNGGLVPGNRAPMLGVRMPILRETAKEIAAEDGFGYISAIQKEEKAGRAYHEELLLHGMVIGYLTCTAGERKTLLDGFVPRIDSWAVCDSCCMTYKFMKKDREDWYAYLQKYRESRQEYEIRFAVVALLDHFLTEDFIDRVLFDLGRITHEGYYVKMAVAWAVSVCYVKFPEKTWALLAGKKLDDFTHQKSIQKIRESYRVTAEDKERLTALSRLKK